MKILKLIIYLAAIFTAGFCSGGLVAVKVAPRLKLGGPPPNPAVLWQAHLRQRLDLTPEQMGKISPMVEQAVNGFRIYMVMGMLNNLEWTNARIAPQLTPAQREVFLQLSREQHDFICSQFGGPPGLYPALPSHQMPANFSPPPPMNQMPGKYPVPPPTP